MRVLFSTGSSARYMAPPRLGEEQINCGPDWADRQLAGSYVSLSTPVGEYDLAAVAQRLPGDQKPDAVVCLVDASWRNLPRNLRSFRCPKVLLIADTHHLSQPLSRIIAYARSEPFDRLVVLYDRHHYDILRAGGLEQLFWFPGLTFPHEDDLVHAARSATRDASLSFVGQLGICHPQRVQQLSRLCGHNLPLQVEAVSQREAIRFYGRSLVGFNASLNGDLNLRAFEILSSGAMLLTDRLAPGSGLLEAWSEGRDLVTYGSPDELIERARHALENPAAARSIGEAGANWFDRHFNANERRRAFAALVHDGIAPAAFPQPGARIAARSRSATPLSSVLPAYEHLQEIHRNTDQVSVFLEAGTPGEFAELCGTLPRAVVTTSGEAPPARYDFVTVRTATALQGKVPPATTVWCFDATEKDRVAIVRRFTAHGLMPQPGALLLFTRRQVNTHHNHGALSLNHLEQGDYAAALAHAREELARNPQSVPALLTLAELSQESGNSAQALAWITRLKAIAPSDVRLRRLLTDVPAARLHRRSERLLRTGWTLLEQRNWTQAERCAADALKLRPGWSASLRLLGRARCGAGHFEAGVQCLHEALRQEPVCVEGWRELAELLQAHGRTSDALSAYVHATTLAPEHVETWMVLADCAETVGHFALAREAMERAQQLAPECPRIARWLQRHPQPSHGDGPLDLLICHVEVTRLQGTGVLIKRFFPSSDGFVTLRSRTLYRGETEFGKLSLSVDLPALTGEARRQVVNRLLRPLRIRRILSVPFFATDFEHTIAAQELTGAPLCVYAMDDQTIYSTEVPHALAQAAFQAAQLRLAISPEMVRDYEAAFALEFGLLPPIVTNREDEHPNHWVPNGSAARRCVMVGNIWSAQQFDQLRRFLRTAGLAVDWFGNSKVAWLPQDQEELERDGIFCRGFLPEPVLAARIAEYPFVLIPSGSLDGSEDNEWLTRLSLPSRMVFILTKTHTPMLVLGHHDTAAARFVESLRLGLASSYDADNAAQCIDALTSPERRAEWLENAERAARQFIFPDCGKWIWQSLEVGHVLPCPFDTLFSTAVALAE